MERQNWRRYQRTLKKTVTSRKRARWLEKYSPFFPWAMAIIFSLFFSFSGSSCRTGESHPVTSVDPVQVTPKQFLFSKNDIKTIFNQNTFINLQDKNFKFAVADKILHVETSLDMPLQHYLLDRIEEVKRMKLGKPRYIGIVAIDPETGRVLAMTSFDKEDSQSNRCLSSEFPAASLFKIVTASAAIESGALNPGSTLEYNGGKYTLYRSQLDDRKNRYTNRVTLKQSFAESINPIFGKIGANTLKKDLLLEYAEAFYFNHDINFELPLPQSSFEASDNPYERAELASGFNRRTQISPLHSALLSATILNHGKLLEPTIIDRITNEQGEVLYKNDVKLINKTLSEETSEALKYMMEATIKSGTAKKAFRGCKRDPVLSKLFIGGKTGSISNRQNDLKYDWFAGFAEEKNGSKKIAIAVIVAHEKYLGPRACNYAKLAMKTFFQNVYARTLPKTNKEDYRS
ncbi:MAG: PbpA [Proteobacteria bacterium]|nr:PbpA [Pseudomonadota bacterium]